MNFTDTTLCLAVKDEADDFREASRMESKNA